MVDQRTTGVDASPIMILGVVVTTEDLGGRPGGSSIAKLAVAEHPVGFAPLVTRVRFWREPRSRRCSGLRRTFDGRYAISGYVSC